MNSSPRRLLVVDDDADEVLFVENAFKGASTPIEIRHADSGEAALAAIRSFNPGLILLDLNMPGMDGRDVLRAIKSNDETCGYATVIFSSSEQRADIDACYRDNANAYVVKPRSSEGYRVLAENITRFWFETARL
ncbi:response regulator [Phreatobacter sp. AB_2022a]|uniref:response regulator n=1 Tax=Phreatobacter sp. AB_2022a TaxID=3003134 RepID=UPI002286F58D|nr:response regulator [Phreatobacter sp. AB_2022a]MCZ0733625.1 response regulator [Phreatobacter sp. AB_2022a]